MKLLFKGVKFIGGRLNGENTNLSLINGQVDFADTEAQDFDEVIDIPGLCVSEGWFDLRVTIGEPGFENRETFSTAARAAARGGFTQIAVMPSHAPVTQNRGSVTMLLANSDIHPVDFLPVAALTTDLQGNELTEITDLHLAGAIAFSDGDKTINRADVMLRALQYMQPAESLIIQRPLHKELAANGLMHEGKRSTMLGLKGVPGLAEDVVIERDIQLVEYAGGKLHFSLVSTAAGVEKIRQAKKRGLSITCDTAAHQLAFTDETIDPFDTNFKIMPPFRSDKDRAALIQGLKDGTVDALVSDHRPHDTEGKELEFDLAEFGVTGLETAFAVANTELASTLSLTEIISKFTDSPRKVLGLQRSSSGTDSLTNLTFFHPEKEWVFRKEETESLSRNSPFYGKTLKGKVFATFTKNKLTRNRFWG